MVIAGNHDMTFDLEFIKQKRKTWMWELTRENYESRLEAYGVDSVHDLMTNCTNLQDSLIEIDGIKIFGSPWYNDMSFSEKVQLFYGTSELQNKCKSRYFDPVQNLIEYKCYGLHSLSYL